MRILLIFVACLFYTCAAKDDRRRESAIDSNSTVVDTSTYDGGFSDLGKDYKNTESENIVYDSVSTRHCEYKKLSSKFNIQVQVVKQIDTVEGHVLSTVKLLLFDKINNILFDSIQLISRFHYGTIFEDCKNVRSYTTGFNKSKQALDNNYGDIVVADFNFDNREDIALINDMGGNAGSLYSFFIQNEERKFVKDAFLTDSMEFCPSEINKTNKTLTTYVHAGVCGLGEHIYVYDSSTGFWKEESHKIINICK